MINMIIRSEKIIKILIQLWIKKKLEMSVKTQTTYVSKRREYTQSNIGNYIPLVLNEKIFKKIDLTRNMQVRCHGFFQKRHVK